MREFDCGRIEGKVEIVGHPRMRPVGAEFVRVAEFHVDYGIRRDSSRGRSRALGEVVVGRRGCSRVAGSGPASRDSHSD